ncbi:MAG: FHA domain-containing protein [Pirellulales bacterium]
MDAKLVVVGGEAKAGEVKIKKLPSVVGRGDEADIRLRHPLVSRKHCEFFELDGVLKVRDLGSLNGTFIANAKIKEAVLKPDELITIGPVVFRAVYEGPTGMDADDEFNFDIDDEADVSETQPMNITKTASLRETVAADDLSLDDFEIDADDDEKPAASAAADDDDFGDLDFDIDLSDETPAPKAKAAAKKEAAKVESGGDDFGDLDLEFDINDSVEEKPAAKAKADISTDNDDDFADLLSVDDADFEIDMDEEPAAKESAAKKPAKQEAKSKPAAKPADEVAEFDIDAIDGDDEELDDFLKDIGMEN